MFAQCHELGVFTQLSRQRIGLAPGVPCLPADQSASWGILERRFCRVGLERVVAYVQDTQPTAEPH